jgi:hypothetical protein
MSLVVIGKLCCAQHLVEEKPKRWLIGGSAFALLRHGLVPYRYLNGLDGG